VVSVGPGSRAWRFDHTLPESAMPHGWALENGDDAGAGDVANLGPRFHLCP
jgi:hypothetical protein